MKKPKIKKQKFLFNDFILYRQNNFKKFKPFFDVIESFIKEQDVIFLSNSIKTLLKLCHNYYN